MDVVLAQPRGFCAGVVRAIDIVERALTQYGAPVYVYHDIVHNAHVVAALRKRGAIFVDEISAISAGAVTVFSAHGVADAIRAEALQRGLHIIDATCPLVEKVHAHARRYARSGAQIVLIGHAGHDEVVGTQGVSDQPMLVVGSVADVSRLQIRPGQRVAYVTQTTLSVDDTREIIEALRARFPAIEGPATDDICYATQNRQNGVRALAARVDLILVVGDSHSSNASRLQELAAQSGCRSHLIEDAARIDPAWLVGVGTVGVTAGASTPDFLVQGVCHRLGGLGLTRISELPGVQESVVFRLPDEVAGPRRPPPDRSTPRAVPRAVARS